MKKLFSVFIIILSFCAFLSCEKELATSLLDDILIKDTIIMNGDTLVFVNDTIISSGNIFDRCVKAEGSIVTEDRILSGFTSIDFKGVGQLEIKQGDTEKVEVSDYQNLTNLILTKVEDNRLIISYSDTCVIDGQPKIIVTLPFLNSLSFSGAGGIDILSKFENITSIVTTGSGNIKMHESCSSGSLNVDLSGTGNIILSGTVDNLTAVLKGTGNIEGKMLTSNLATAQLLGNGNITLRVISKLVAQANGIGNIYYYGNPTVEKSETLLSKVVKIED